MVTDQLPSTPSRKTPPQFGARLIMGALTGLAIGLSHGLWITGLIAGAVGAVIGTYGGAAVRARLAGGFGKDSAGRLHRGRRRDRWRRSHRRRRGVRWGRRMKSFDAIIIGAGQAGPSLAGRFNEPARRWPSSSASMLAAPASTPAASRPRRWWRSAYAARLARRGAEYGVVLDAPVKIDMPTVMRRSHQVTLDSRHGNERGWRDDDCTLIRGHASFEEKIGAGGRATS